MGKMGRGRGSSMGYMVQMLLAPNIASGDNADTFKEGS